MKIILCFVLLFTACCCIDSEGSENYWREDVDVGAYPVDSRHHGREHDVKLDYQHNYDRHHDSKVRPCSLHNVNCIRSVFAHISKCSPVHGPAPDPYMIKKLPLDIPQANLSLTLNDVHLEGLNHWKIKEFYINKDTDRLVLEVEFDRLVVSSPRAVVSFHRKGKEPLEVSDYSMIEYFDISLTLTIPNIEQLQLSNAHVYSYIPDVLPRYKLGPAITSSPDHFVKLVLRQWLNNIGLSLQEVFIVQGSAFMSAFLQSTICSFGH